MAKKDNFNNNDPISKAVDLLLENTEDLTTVFKEGGLYKELTKSSTILNNLYTKENIYKVGKNILDSFNNVF